MRKPPPREEPLFASDLLLRVEATVRHGDVEPGALLAAAGSQAHAMALVVLALPLPICRHVPSSAFRL